MPQQAFLRLLGHCYRPGSRKPLASPRSGGDEGDGGNDDDGDGDDDEDGSDDDSRDKSPARTPKKKKNKTTEALVPSAPPQGAQDSAVRMVREQIIWKEGIAPTGGFELETCASVQSCI